MGIRVALRHNTTYKYDRPVTFNPHVVRLRPAPHTRTPVLAYSLDVGPKPHFLNWQQDPYSNYHARLVFPNPARELSVTVDLIADLTTINPFDFFTEEYADNYPFQYDKLLTRELAPYLETLPLGPRLRPIVDEFRPRTGRTVDLLGELNNAVFSRLQYLIRLEHGVQTPEETLELARGSCRDFAWLLVQLCRHLGLAARFVSGYSIQLVADEKPVDGPAGVVEDVVDLHAWAEIFLPGAGWVGLDATCGLFTGSGYIPLACTADPSAAAPITGGFSWSKDPTRPNDDVAETFAVEMSVTRIVDHPRVTKPYTEDQWQAIDALGKQVDAELEEWDVRLTMGGEPTFVSIDERDAPEWNITALGPNKRKQGMTLAKRLRDKFAPGGFVHFGQGKWYPGESLPRWAFGCWWRKDGQPIWSNPKLVGDEDSEYTFGPADALRFAQSLASAINVDPAHILAGHEDAMYYLWKERRLPANVKPLDSKLADPEERATLSRVFEQGLDAVVGYALPVRRDYGGVQPTWQSGPWHLRREAMFLVPGDSPMGFRLPLDTIPWEPGSERQFTDPKDPFAPRGPLPSYVRETMNSGSAKTGDSRPPLAKADKYTVPANVVRTAMTIEARDGRMFVFMPPLRFLEDYLDLIAAVEATASATNIPVFVEGYRPPSDPRVNHFSITPDPGVIEANMHPAESWDETVRMTETLYEEAKQTRLSTEKFMLDGRHTGTGGGNHIVLGGPSAGESPILRRPDLLRSMLGFWQNHPSLSFLFSGLFVGPTSQHPRVDEARHDALYELEIAFTQVNKGRESTEGSSPPPAWLVDRAFRHLLADVTGNTHRTEFCIDKLYSPDTPEGRRGLLELRSFEMPPHARMSLAQQLLIRACVAAFWKKPYTRPLTRWGTQLHDRFMLPHFVTADLNDALDELRREGFAFDPAWFAPHREFRFPRLGEVAQASAKLELRTAIEPWHVLGEEAGAGGAARYVDSSVERVQVKVSGLTDDRHVITCNGRRVPLHPTGVHGEFVAGVRFRAWQPPSCLHPTIPSHSPLVFDIIDTWSDRSLGGCTYSVSHPGGLSYETFPVNALEAESRRQARFQAFGHSPGPVSVPPPETNPEFPYTLDLRRS